MNKHTMNHHDLSDAEKQMRDLLRSSERELDTNTVQSLAHARSEALKSASTKGRPASVFYASNWYGPRFSHCFNPRVIA